MRRARNAAGALAAVTIGAAAVLMTFATAQASAPNPPALAPVPAVARAPVSTVNGNQTLIVDSTTELPVDNASIAVRGKGFDVQNGLYIAVCQDGSGAPQSLTKCVGGAVPDDNTSTGWAHITSDGQGQGGIKAAWGPEGSFSVTLALPKVDEGDVDCLTAKCSLYTASDDDSIRTEDNAVPLAFAAPATSSSEPPPTTPSSTAPTAPGTAIVQVVQNPSIAAGATQLVVFSGFQPGEEVNLTLFSAPVTLSPVKADPTGVAQAEFVVPADLAVGTHRLEAIGQQSRTVGVASFQVTAPPVSTSATPSSTASSSSTPSSSQASSSPSTSSAPASSSASSAAPTAVTPTAAAGTSDDGGSSLWWLWLILAVVVLAAVITGIVVYRRNQEQQQRERDEQEITDAAAREQNSAASGYGTSGDDAPTVFLPPVPPSGPPPGADPYGLLSGHDQPPYPGADPAGPTEELPPPDHNQGRGPYGSPLGQGQGEGYRPPASDAIDGPGTQAWTPDEDDTTPGDPPTGNDPGPDERR